jgi:hypothetical protein
LSQQRIDCTANELLVLEVVHVHALRIAFGTIISSAILESAAQTSVRTAIWQRADGVAESDSNFDVQSEKSSL